MENPLILAIETSGKTGGIAFLKGNFLASFAISSKESYSKILFRALTCLEDSFNFSLEDIDYYAIDIGPGSFTGLRIGFSVLKAFSLIYPKPVIPVCSLEVLAFNFAATSLPVVSLINAYSKEVFMAIYKWKKFEAETCVAPCCIPLEKLPEHVKEPSLFISETLEVWEDFLKEKLRDYFIKPEIPVNITPELVAKLAYLKLKQNRVELKNAEELTPFYLKASEAERKSGLKLT